MNFRKIVKAYTVVELMIMLVILGMLSSIAVSSYNSYIVMAKVTVIKKTVNDLYRYTIIKANADDKFYSELDLEEIVNEFKIKKPEYTEITYVASDTDFFYQATLPDGEVWRVGVVSTVYAENNKYYVEGTERAIEYFKSLDDTDRANFTKARYDSVVKDALIVLAEDDFEYKLISSPWEKSAPDKDRDTVPDQIDVCPEKSGPVDNEGCPLVDSDNDGVYDRDDNCPEEYGDRYNYGCLLPDTDNE